VQDLTGGHSDPAPEGRSGELEPVEVLLDIAPDSLIVVRGGRIVAANELALRMFEYDRSRMLGLSLESLLPTEFIKRHDGLRESYEHDPERRPMRSTATLDALARDGRKFPVEVRLGSVRSGDEFLTIASIREIGDRLTVERRLDEEIHRRRELTRDREGLLRKAAYLETINTFAIALIQLRTVDEILWAVARSGVAKLGFEDCVVYLLDEETDRLVQMAAHGPKNPAADDIYNPITIPVGEGIVGAVVRSGRSELVRDTRLDPRYITDDVSRRSELAVPIVRDGKVIGVVDSEHPDVDFYTEDHRQIMTTIASMASAKIDTALTLEALQGAVARLTEAEERLVNVAEDLRQARDEAEQASQTKSDFMAVMSHEIRTPMNAILGMTDLVLDTSLNRNQRELLQTAQTNAEALLGIINEVLDFTKLEAGALQLRPTDFSVVDVVDGVVEALSAQAAGKALRMTAVLSPDLPPVSYGDARRFRQVLLNLVGNAVKFTPEGGEVLVRAQLLLSESNRIRIEVTDSGIGVSEEDAALIFRPFYQADHSLTKSFEGSGLGLGISHSLLTLMGGRIEVSSELGVGTTFIADIPFELSNHAFPKRRASDRAFTGHSIRLAVSDLVVREATVASIEALGIEILHDDNAHAGGDHRFLIVDGEDPGSPGGERIDETGVGRPGEKVLLLCPPGSPAELGPRARSVHVISKPLTRRKLATALIDRAASRGGAARLKAAREPLHAKILVVEDSRDNQRYLLRVLKDEACRADLAVDGEEGAAMAIGGHYDVVVTDVQMPKVDGLEMTRRIRAAEREAGRVRTPIIALSAHAGEDFRERCLSAGMDAHLSKPFRRAELTELIESFLGVQKSVLVIDDDSSSRHLVTLYLEHERVRVVGVGTIAEGRSRLADGFDLVLLDRNLPDGDGLELARELSAEADGPSVIIITGHVGPEHRRAAEDAGAGYLSKPIRRPEFLETIRGALAGHDEGRSARAGIEGAASTGDVVQVEADIADLVEEFLDDWRLTASGMEALLDAGDFSKLRRIGHNLKGSGAGYGFAELSRVGDVIELAAEKIQHRDLRAGIQELTAYLASVMWQVK